MVTASMPIYYEEAGIRTILGVAGIDVVMQTFTDFGITEEEDVVKELIKNAPCHKSSLTECEIETIRPEDSKCRVTCNNTNTSGIINCVYTTNTIF